MSEETIFNINPPYQHISEEVKEKLPQAVKKQLDDYQDLCYHLVNILPHDYTAQYYKRNLAFFASAALGTAQQAGIELDENEVFWMLRFQYNSVVLIDECVRLGIVRQ